LRATDQKLGFKLGHYRLLQIGGLAYCRGQSVSTTSSTQGGTDYDSVSFHLSL
jgi:hypothetical protein